MRAEKILQQRLFDHPKIEIVWNSAVEEILADGEPRGVTGVRLKNTVTGSLTQLPADGVFVAIGHKPSTDLFVGIVEPGTTRTSVPGVFAAGDVADETYRQAVTAAGLGCMAALEAEKFLAHHAAPQAVAAE